MVWIVLFVVEVGGESILNFAVDDITQSKRNKREFPHLPINQVVHQKVPVSGHLLIFSVLC